MLIKAAAGLESKISMKEFVFTYLFSRNEERDFFILILCFLKTNKEKI